MNGLKKIFFYLFPFIVLYLTIWLHELGHSVMAFALSCKTNWWQTDVSWYLWDSWGGEIDYNCLEQKGSLALAAVDGTGILVNIIFLILILKFGLRKISVHLNSKKQLFFLFLFWWALANYAEAFSYLVLNTIWLKSDMATVVTATGINRFFWLAAGILLAVFFIRKIIILIHKASEIYYFSSKQMAILVCAYITVVGGLMGLARIILT